MTFWSIRTVKGRPGTSGCAEKTRPQLKSESARLATVPSSLRETRCPHRGWKLCRPPAPVGGGPASVTLIRPLQDCTCPEMRRKNTLDDGRRATLLFCRRTKGAWPPLLCSRRERIQRTSAANAHANTILFFSLGAV